MSTIVLLFVFTLFSLVSFVAILISTDPYSTNTLTRILFFITLFFSLLGGLSIAGAIGSRLRGGKGGEAVAFRRGTLLAALAVFLVLLETFSMLTIINASAVFLLVVSLELLAVYKQ